MKVLHINSSDLSGGAARAAYRLHLSLISVGVDSKMLVSIKETDQPDIFGPISQLQKATGRIMPALDRFAVNRYENRLSDSFSTGRYGLDWVVDKIQVLKPDIVHLHWISQGLINIKKLSNIGKPLVWTMHDMWPFTGGCHYSSSCDAFTRACGSCPILGSADGNDLSRSNFNSKKKSYSKVKNITFIGPSRWIADCASKSALLQNHRIVTLPNAVDVNRFRPVKKELARQVLDLTEGGKKYILFGAVSATKDKRKGYKELVEGLAQLENKESIEILIFGSKKPESYEDFGIKMNFFGHLYDDISLQLLYCAADVTVVPSLQENLSNTIIESLSCGTPVVAFNIGGNSDMIDHKKTGYLAQEADGKDLSRGIEWILNSSVDFAEETRMKCLSNYNYTKVGNLHLRLYQELLDTKQQFVFES